jgi:hypothetical protein
MVAIGVTARGSRRTDVGHRHPRRWKETLVAAQELVAECNDDERVGVGRARVGRSSASAA